MSRVIPIERAPYDKKEKIFTKKEFLFEPGLTVLVGCNGSGKTTLIKTIKSELDKKSVPYFDYDNLHEGGSHSTSKAMYFQNYEFAATLMSSSEGEGIVMNMGNCAQKIGAFVRKNPDIKELWIMFDAVDSGLSIDNIIDLKEFLFKTVLGTNPDKDIYIIVSANEYEMCRQERCFDVRRGKYLRFDDYESYRKFILQSKKEKDKRYKDDTQA